MQKTCRRGGNGAFKSYISPTIEFEIRYSLTWVLNSVLLTRPLSEAIKANNYLFEKPNTVLLYNYNIVFDLFSGFYAIPEGPWLMAYCSHSRLIPLPPQLQRA